MSKRRSRVGDVTGSLSGEPNAQQSSEKPTAPLKRAEFIVSGRTLAGVYQKIIYFQASLLGITGTVEEHEDGTLRIVAEGEDGDIQKFQEALRVKKPPIMVEEVRKVGEGEIKKRAEGFEFVPMRTAEVERGKNFLYWQYHESRIKAISEWMCCNEEIEETVGGMTVKGDLLDFTIYGSRDVWKDIAREVMKAVPEVLEVPNLLERRDEVRADLNDVELRLLNIYPKVARAVKSLSNSRRQMNNR